MKPNKMTLSQQIEYYRQKLDTCINANDRLIQSNNAIKEINLQLLADNEWLKKIITKLVEHG